MREGDPFNRALDTFAEFEKWRGSADVIEQAGDTLAQMEYATGLKASPSIEAQIKHHKRAYVHGEIELDELELRVERLLPANARRPTTWPCRER